MIIGIVSDTHRNRVAVDHAFQFFQQKGAKLVFCLGDVCQDVRDRDIEYDMEVVCVAGNMDFSSPYPTQRVHEVDGIRFLLTHGHTFAVHYSHRHLIEEAKQNQCQVALYGHTHVPFNAQENGVLLLNPGSASEPRGGSKASVAIIDTSTGKPKAQVYWLKEVEV